MNEPRAQQLASLLQGIEDLKQEKAAWTAEWKDRMERLITEAAQLRNDILTGQMRIEDAIEEEEVTS